MTARDILESFTADYAGRYNIDRPWRELRDGATRAYATNGYAAVRLPLDDAELQAGGWPELYALFAGVAWEQCIHDLPSASGEMEAVECPVEHVREGSCDVCDGYGEHECPDCEATHECGACDGTGRGEVPTQQHPASCECLGIGTIPAPATEEIDGLLFGGRPLALIRQFADVQYAIVPGPSDQRMLVFTADGGVQGILCSRRRESGESHGR